MTANFRKALGATLLGLTAAISAPMASAAVVTGSWDPVLPAPFMNLGWVATVNMRIDDNCVVNTSSNFSVNVFGRSFGCLASPRRQDFTVLRAQVGLYSTISGTLIDVLDFNNSMGAGIDRIGQSSNSFLLTLNESNPVGATALGTLGYSFILRVPGERPVLSYQDTRTPGTFIDATGTPILTRFDVQPNGSQATVLANTLFTVGQVVAPRAVPEPGSLALALLALLATGAVAARRTRRAALAS